MLSPALLLIVSLQSAASSAPPPAVARYQKKVGTALAVNHPVHLFWKGQAYGVSGTTEDELSASRWRQHLVLPEIPLEDTVVVEGNQVSELDTNGQLKKLSGSSRAFPSPATPFSPAPGSRPAAP